MHRGEGVRRDSPSLHRHSSKPGQIVLHSGVRTGVAHGSPAMPSAHVGRPPRSVRSYVEDQPTPGRAADRAPIMSSASGDEGRFAIRLGVTQDLDIAARERIDEFAGPSMECSRLTYQADLREHREQQCPTGCERIDQP